MNTLYNGEDVTKENVLSMLKEEAEGSSDMSDEEISVIKKIASQDYEGCDEDLQYLTEKLQSKNSVVGYNYPQANLQTVYDIVSQSEWHYMV